MGDDYAYVLLEDIQGKLQAVAEAVGMLQDGMKRVEKRLDKVEESTRLIPTIIAAITDQGRQITNHERRINKLETA